MDLIFSLIAVKEENDILQYCFVGFNLFFGSIAILLCWVLYQRETETESSVPVEYQSVPVKYQHSKRPSVGNTLDITTTDPRLIIRDSVQQSSTNF